MFPLNSNDQYIDSNGKRSTLGNAIGSGGGSSELPEHTSADAGKVLKVADDGSLEWDEDGGAGGVYVGTTNPDPLIGENGDYYYKRFPVGVEWSSVLNIVGYFGYGSFANEFVAKEDILITHITYKPATGQTVSFRIGKLDAALETISSVALDSSVLNHIALTTPIEIAKDEHFIIQVFSPNNGRVYQAGDTTNIVGDTSIAEYVKSYSGNAEAYPGTVAGNPSTLSFEYAGEYDLVTAQYYKTSDTWTLIS